MIYVHFTVKIANLWIFTLTVTPKLLSNHGLHTAFRRTYTNVNPHRSYEEH